MIGYCKTKTQLIAQSKLQDTLQLLCIEFPFQNGPDSAFACCGVNYFPINCVVNVRGLNDLFINYSDLAENQMPVPRNLISGEILTKDDISIIYHPKTFGAQNQNVIPWQQATMKPFPDFVLLDMLMFLQALTDKKFLLPLT